MIVRSIFSLCLYCTACLPVWGFDSFIIEDIEIEGLQRISLGTAFNYLPIKVGESLDADKVTVALRALYKTGFFEDVSFDRSGNNIVIRVVERPSIASIKLFGNEEINSDDLLDALKKIGLAEGRVFNRSLLDKVNQELHRQYFSLGKYGVKIESTIRELVRNRVDVEIDIKEGDAARIVQIYIIGAKAFDSQRLLDQIELTSPTLFSGMSGSENYSKQQLLGDLETLRSYYLNRGYINFNIDSTQVSISPDKKDVFITINITEGDQFVVNNIAISGELVVPKEELIDLISLKNGNIFSRRELVKSSNKITDRLGVSGYAFANVNAIPKIDKKNKEIAIEYFVDPGKRVYVRRINIRGNVKTQDAVVRRELRQMEGGWISTPLINRSKVRLQRLGYFDEVKVESIPVPGTTDQVDVNFDVVEGSTGNFTAGIGYGQTGGFLFNTSVTLNNFLGTGKRVALELNNSQVRQIYSFSYRNPYYTIDGISRSLTVFSRATDARAANLSNFNTDDIGASIDYGFPLSEFVTARFGIGFEKTFLDVNEALAPDSIKKFVGDFGDKYENYKTTASLAYDSRNRALFPDSGFLTRIAVETTFPGSDLEYYKASLRNKIYFSLAPQVSLLFGLNYSYGDGYSTESPHLPFFENFYAGGTRSVRGFRGNTIGPKDKDTGNPVGGFRKITGKIELFFPSPFADEPSNKFRLSLFSDFGRVYSVFGEGNEDGVDPDDDIRATYGFAAVWITPVGALTFSWAWPLKSEMGDSLERFGFNIGAPF